MSENERTSRAEIEQVVAKEFEAAGYEVSQSVGMQPGEVDWFARPKTGLERSTTYWQVWDACPYDLDDALLSLEQTRQRKGADRALAVMNGALPKGYAADLQRRLSNAITLNRLIIELRGFADQVREQKARHEPGVKPNQFLPRKGRTLDGEVVDAVTYIKTWLRVGEGKSLAVVARKYSGRSTLIARVAYELSIEFEKDPENVIPLIVRSLSSAHDGLALDSRDKDMRTIHSVDADGGEAKKESQSAESVLELIEPTDSDVEDWFKAHSIAPEVAEQFRSARDEVAEFKELSNEVPNLIPLLASIRRSSSQVPKDAKEWMAEVVSSYVETQLLRSIVAVRGEVKSGAGSAPLTDRVSTLEDAAFQHFALGKTAPTHTLVEILASKYLSAALSTWLVLGPPAPVRIEGKFARRQLIVAFSNSLVRDYFVARKIAREITAGNSAILARYQFPKDYVLLFLATLSPSAAAQATAERGAEIRAEIEAEVERRLQLTLAHQLKRSAGAVRASLRSIQRAIQKKMKPEWSPSPKERAPGSMSSTAAPASGPKIAIASSSRM